MAKLEEILTFSVFIAILVLIPQIQSQSDDDANPLCITQFALVNHACAFLRFTPPPDDDGDDSPSPPDGGGSDDRPPSPPDGGGGGHDRPPSPPDGGDNQSLVDDDDGDDHHNHHHHHHRHHRHRHRQRDSDSDPEEDCCRWLKEVDDQCVCAMLFRLPPFLSKLEHDYTVIVNDDCEVTFECQGMYGD